MCYFTWKLELVSNILWIIVDLFNFYLFRDKDGHLLHLLSCDLLVFMKKKKERNRKSKIWKIYFTKDIHAFLERNNLKEHFKEEVFKLCLENKNI